MSNMFQLYNNIIFAEIMCVNYTSQTNNINNFIRKNKKKRKRRDKPEVFNCFCSTLHKLNSIKQSNPKTSDKTRWGGKWNHGVFSEIPRIDFDFNASLEQLVNHVGLALVGGTTWITMWSLIMSVKLMSLLASNNYSMAEKMVASGIAATKKENREYKILIES